MKVIYKKTILDTIDDIIKEHKKDDTLHKIEEIRLEPYEYADFKYEILYPDGYSVYYNWDHVIYRGVRITQASEIRGRRADWFVIDDPICSRTSFRPPKEEDWV